LRPEPLRPVDPRDRVEEGRVLSWSHREKWEKAGPLGGVVLTLDDALTSIASEPVFWIWA
jgi:hypothetical protein